MSALSSPSVNQYFDSAASVDRVDSQSILTTTYRPFATTPDYLHEYDKLKSKLPWIENVQVDTRTIRLPSGRYYKIKFSFIPKYLNVS